MDAVCEIREFVDSNNNVIKNEVVNVNDEFKALRENFAKVENVNDTNSKNDSVQNLLKMLEQNLGDSKLDNVPLDEDAAFIRDIEGLYRKSSKVNEKASLLDILSKFEEEEEAQTTTKAPGKANSGGWKKGFLDSKQKSKPAAAPIVLPPAAQEMKLPASESGAPPKRVQFDLPAPPNDNAQTAPVLPLKVSDGNAVVTGDATSTVKPLVDNTRKKSSPFSGKIIERF